MTRRALIPFAVWATTSLASAQTPTPQNPSPMTDTTRPHPRVAEYVPEGRRAAVGRGTLFIRAGLRSGNRTTLIVHFHGAPWLVEHHIARLNAAAILVTFQLGSGSGVYGSCLLYTSPSPRD